MSFTYFHAYMPELWQAQIKAGLINKSSGIRFCQSIDIDEKLKFNNLAQKEGELFGIINETRMPFYIDRLQGGCFFEGYDYDMSLVGQYRDILGDNFYGFQMHEWMSNFISDTAKLTNGNCPVPWTEENIIKTLKRDFPYKHVFTEAMSAKEYAQTGYITDIDFYLEAMKKLFLKRQTYTDGMVIPCDSCALAFKLEFLCGAKRVMAEIGQQTPDTCVQLALARGTAAAFGKSFGAYYEPWGGEPFSACNYHRQSKNEWNISDDNFPFKTAGDNAGSSRSLQKRLQLYAYVSGAQFICEEWGLCNTFYDWTDFELTPYGKIKKDFISFTEKYPDIGKPVVPIAAVIPKEVISLDGIRREDGKYFGFETKSEFSEKLISMRSGLRELFSYTGNAGNENGCMVNRSLPDAIDIVNEDVYIDEKYEYAVNLTGNVDFEKNHKCCKTGEVGEILERLLPCKIESGLHSVINKNSKEEYYLTLFNNTGIVRSVAQGEYALSDATKTVRAEFKHGRTLKKLEGEGILRYENGAAYITVPAGGFFFGKF